MIEYFSGLAAIKSEVSMAEVHKDDCTSEDQEPRVISLALFFKGVVSQFIAVRLIVKLGVFLECLGKRIAREDMTMMEKREVVVVAVRILNNNGSRRCALETVEEKRLFIETLAFNELVVRICCLNVMSMLIIVMIIVMAVAGRERSHLLLYPKHPLCVSEHTILLHHLFFYIIC